MKIAGKVYRFGCHSSDYTLFPKFWYSGGACGFTDNYSDSYAEHDKWLIDVSDLPEELIPYAAEIDQEFNANVLHGCCGGCL